MAEALHIDRDRLILSPPDRDVPERFWDMVERRKAGEPVAYITGRRAFWNIELHVGPGVLVPRPDSEVLIASAIEHFDGTRRARSASSTSAPGPERCCSPRSTSGRTRPASASTSRARRCPMPRPMRGGSASKARAEARAGQLGARASIEKFDLILCNPPYVADGAELGPGVREYEPDEALVRRRGRARRLSRAGARSCRDCSTAAALRRSRSAPTRPRR